MAGPPYIPEVRNDRLEACKTFIEQTKLLMSLASAFIIAPAAIQAFLKLEINWLVLMAEGLFVISVLSSYIALGSVTGSQYEGSFNIYRTATRISGMIQFFSYLIGLICFGFWVTGQPKLPDEEKLDGAALTITSQTTYVKKYPPKHDSVINFRQKIKSKKRRSKCSN